MTDDDRTRALEEARRVAAGVLGPVADAFEFEEEKEGYEAHATNLIATALLAAEKRGREEECELHIEVYESWAKEEADRTYSDPENRGRHLQRCGAISDVVRDLKQRIRALRTPVPGTGGDDG